MAAIRKRSDKWQARVKRNGQSLDKTFLTKADAERWARIVESDIERGVFKSPSELSGLTLKAALLRYGQEVTPTKRGSEAELFRVKALSRRTLARKLLADIKTADIATYRDQLLGDGLKASTVVKELALISVVFKTAISEWGLEDLVNPVPAVRKPIVRNSRSRRLSAIEEHWLLQAVTLNGRNGRRGESHPVSIWTRPIILMALETGMRRGELLGMRWEHVDLVRRIVHLPLTKNGSRRDIPLTKAAREVLEALPRSIDGRVFPVSINAFKLAFIRAVGRAKDAHLMSGGCVDYYVFEDLHFHDLRHEAISRFFERGLNMMEVAAISGHKTLSMLSRYTHLRAEDLVRKLG